MNCQEFENGLDALARGSLADARTRLEASAHADACARCAARLADERALTEGLRAMASRLKAAEAPPRVESALLAALRARAASVAAAASADAGRDNVSPLAARDNNSALAGRADARRWSLTKTVAVAALAAAAAVAFFMLIPPGMSVPPPHSAGEVAATQAAREGDPGAPAAQEQEQPGVQTADADEGPAQTTPDSTLIDDNRLQRAALASRASGRARASEASFNSGGGRIVAQARRGGVEDAGVEEIMTDFFPLMQGGRFAQGEGGHLVRVELPRSALTSFGLPVNAEAAGGRVKADVLLGEDGLARAIRFVR